MVGVDDDPMGMEALQWAAAEAVLRQVQLVIVHSWQAVVPLEPAGMVSPPANVDLEEGSRSVLDEIVADGRARAAAWPEDVSVRIEEGPPGPVLVDVAEKEAAGLLVVGSKGHRALSEVLLGSVSRHCTHHAPCPVVVVRPTTRS